MKSENLVTPSSLRLGLELSGEENCIEFHPILLDCKVRKAQNLAGSVPKTPTSANILTQKKEQKSLLLKSKYLLGKYGECCINTNAQPTGEHEVHTSSYAHGPSIENRINMGFFHNSSGAIREAKKYYNNVD